VHAELRPHEPLLDPQAQVEHVLPGHVAEEAEGSPSRVPGREVGRAAGFEWDGGVEFHLARGEWIRLLRANGFEIEALVELQAPAGAEAHSYYDFVSADWARRWPADEIWKARKVR
jgi:hypothetical protein